MNILLNFHLNEANEPFIARKFSTIILDMARFLFNIRKSNAQERIQFLENKTELIKYLNKLFKWHFAILLDSFVYHLQAFYCVLEVKLSELLEVGLLWLHPNL